MKIYVSDENIDLRDILNNAGLERDTKIIVEDLFFKTEKYWGKENNISILASCSKAEVEMIDQHDTEVRSDERKKVLEELSRRTS